MARYTGKLSDPWAIQKYGGYADQAQNAAMTAATGRIGRLGGGEMAGTPAVLARGLGPGAAARMRRRMLEKVGGSMGEGLSTLGAQTAEAKRNFAGGILGAQEEARLGAWKEDRNKKPGWQRALSGIAGIGLGYLTGGPAGAVTGAVKSAKPQYTSTGQGDYRSNYMTGPSYDDVYRNLFR